MNIIDALKKLDPKNDAHWTDEGLPQLAVATGVLGKPVSRAMLTKEAPGFNRASAAANGSTATAEAQDGTAPAAGSDVDVPELPTAPAETSNAHASLESDDSNKREALITKISKLNSDILRMQDEIRESQNMLAKLSDKSASSVSHTSYVISDYLKSQQKIREDKTRTIKAINESGLDLKELTKIISPAPIDSARQTRR